MQPRKLIMLVRALLADVNQPDGGWSDEAMKQLVSETAIPIPVQPGQPERFDYQYERNGTANLFMLCNPIEGWRTVEVTERRTAIDYAQLLKKLVDDYYPEAYLITVVQDNLNTHTPASLYKAFEPSEARRIMNRKRVLLHTQAWKAC